MPTRPLIGQPVPKYDPAGPKVVARVFCRTAEQFKNSPDCPVPYALGNPKHRYIEYGANRKQRRRNIDYRRSVMGIHW